MMSGEVRAGPTADVLNDEALSELYDTDVRTVTYQHGGVDRQAIVTTHDGEREPPDHRAR